MIMNEEILRKKSLDKAKSPESIDDYIRVSSPGVWLLLISVIVLLIGAVVWGIFGHIDSTVSASVRIENGTAVCYIAEENMTSVKVGQTVKFEDHEAVIESVGNKTDDGYVCTLSNFYELADGFYEGKVIVESYKPLLFVLN